MLKGNKKTVTELEYYQVDTAITDFLLSKGFSKKDMTCSREGYVICAENEWSNDSEHSFDVEPEVLEDQTTLKYVSTNEILNWMCAEGKIEAGEYLINVCW